MPSTSNEMLCSENSRNLFSKIKNSLKPRLNLKDIGVFQLIDEIERVRKLWKTSEESNERLNIEMRETEEAFSKRIQALIDENKALKQDLNEYETREKQLKEAMKNGAFDSLSKEDRDQFAFLWKPLVRTYSKRVQQRHPHLTEDTQDDDDDREVDDDETGDSSDLRDKGPKLAGDATATRSTERICNSSAGESSKQN